MSPIKFFISLLILETLRFFIIFFSYFQVFYSLEAMICQALVFAVFKVGQDPWFLFCLTDSNAAQVLNKPLKAVSRLVHNWLDSAAKIFYGIRQSVTCKSSENMLGRLVSLYNVGSLSHAISLRTYIVDQCYYSLFPLCAPITHTHRNLTVAQAYPM